MTLANRMPTDLLTNEEAASILRIEPTTLKKWRCIGIGPTPTYMGGKPLYMVRELEKYILQRTRIDARRRYDKARKTA